MAEVQQNRKADLGLLAFVDALAAFMSGDNERCILNLCLCIEILGNKRRILKGFKDVDFNALLRTSELLEAPDQQLAKRMFIDRGPIAHGRIAPNLMQDSGIVEEYLTMVRRVVDKYLTVLQAGEWSKATSIQVGRPRQK